MLVAHKLSSDPVVADLTKPQVFSPFLPIILQMTGGATTMSLGLLLVHSAGETGEAQVGWRTQRRPRWAGRGGQVG